MTPDRTHTIALMAAILEAGRREVAKNDFILDVGRALLLYREAERQVLAAYKTPTCKNLPKRTGTGPCDCLELDCRCTSESKPLPECTMRGTGICTDLDCPRHGNG